MKKILAILMTLMFVIGLCACGNSNTGNETEAPTENSTVTDTTEPNGGTTVTTPENDTENDSSTKNDEVSIDFFDKNGVLVRQTPVAQTYNFKNASNFKDDYIDAVVTGVEVGKTETIITYTVKNLSNYILVSNAKSCTLNGYSIGFNNKKNDTMSVQIAPKATVEYKVTIETSTLEHSDVKYIFNGKLNIGLSVYPTDATECNYRNQVALTFETDCKEKNSPYKDGIVAYDKDGIKIVLQYVGWGNYELLDSYVAPVRILVTNTTDEARTINYQEVLVNGEFNRSVYSNKAITHNITVNPNSSAFCIFNVKNNTDVRKALIEGDAIKNFKVTLLIKGTHGNEDINVNATVDTKR